MIQQMLRIMQPSGHKQQPPRAQLFTVLGSLTVAKRGSRASFALIPFCFPSGFQPYPGQMETGGPSAASGSWFKIVCLFSEMMKLAMD